MSDMHAENKKFHFIYMHLDHEIIAVRKTIWEMIENIQAADPYLIAHVAGFEVLAVLSDAITLEKENTGDQ